jgi:hypothetical protein
MNINEEVIREWFYRLPKGYAEAPYTESELTVLADVIAEHDSNVGKPIPEAVELVTEEEPNAFSSQETPQISETELEKLEDAFRTVALQYSKYLTIFHYFDPNSLGTISEVLLTRLLNNIPGIEAEHTGASGGLADLTIDGTPISLKTTRSGKRIPLGSDTQNVTPGDIRNIAKELRSLKDNGIDVEKIPINQLGEVPELQARINAIANKIAGPNDDEIFVWVEKIYTRDILSGIQIHVRDYNTADVIDMLNNGYIYITSTAWGIRDSNGKNLVLAETGGMALNISPYFVKTTTDAITVETISFPISNITKGKKPEFDDKTFAALDNLYNQLVAGKILEPISTKG